MGGGSSKNKVSAEPAASAAGSRSVSFGPDDVCLPARAPQDADGNAEPGMGSRGVRFSPRGELESTSGVTRTVTTYSDAAVENSKLTEAQADMERL
jgi:hypothetical protein